MTEDDRPLQYSHSGRRYLLGYGREFFGIWDRQEPSRPMARYPRTDDGWRAAWLAFSAAEPDSTEVGIGGPAPAGSLAQAGVGGTGAAGARRVHGAWWLLPILLGWLGGLIAWLVNRDVDPRLARSMLVTGIGISVLAYLVFSNLSST